MDTGTLTAYRLVASRWASSAFSGEGARKYGGRWNSPGRPVVYLSESRALAALELLVHLTTPESRAKTFALIEVTIPADCIGQLALPSLPKTWRTSPPTSSSMEFGNSWIKEHRTLALSVPSVIIPEERNLLLNVTHPKFANIEISEPQTFTFDQRIDARIR